MADAMRVQPWLDAAVKNIGQHALNPLFIASLAETKLDDVAEECVHAAPDDLARIGFAVAHALDASAPAVEGLDSEAAALAQRIADALLARSEEHTSELQSLMRSSYAVVCLKK